MAYDLNFMKEGNENKKKKKKNKEVPVANWMLQDENLQVWRLADT